jgi:hypothetical protein
VIFVTGASIYAVKKQPMDEASALVHIPVLLLFYFVQYFTLKEFLPFWAPWIAFGSMGVLYAAYGLARRAAGVAMPAGGFLVNAYAAVVLVHAGYFELVPPAWKPWVSLTVIIGMVAYAAVREEQTKESWPLYAAASLIFLHNYFRLVFEWNLNDLPGYSLLILLYAITLYLGYWIIRNVPSLAMLSTPLLYIGHIDTMVGTVQILHNRLAVSLVWGVLAVISLILAIVSENKVLARSALFIFAASAIKVWLYDLSGAAPLVRIGCLLILGITLYLGGLLYQKIETSPESIGAAPSETKP